MPIVGSVELHVVVVWIGVVLCSGALPATAHEFTIHREDGTVLHVVDPSIVDPVRTSLVRTFDHASYHHLEGSAWRGEWRSTQGKLVEMVKEIQSETHLEFRFSDPALIRVENRYFQIARLWVTLREVDGATFEWTLETPEGELVRVGGIEGTINRAIAPLYKDLLKRPFDSKAPLSIEPGFGYGESPAETELLSHELVVRSKARGLHRIDDPEDLDLTREVFTRAFDEATVHGQAGSQSPGKLSQVELEVIKATVIGGDHLQFTFSVPVPIQVEGASFTIKEIWVGVGANSGKISHMLFRTPVGELVELDGFPDSIRKECQREVEFYLEPKE